MKTIFSIITIAFFCITVLSFSLQGQTDIRKKRTSTKATVTKVHNSKIDCGRKAILSDKFNSSVTESNILDDIDTLNYPLEGTYALYISNDDGYVCGNNTFGDLAKANYFEIDQECQLTGILLDFAHATGGNADVEIAVWDKTGTAITPGAIIGTSAVPLNTIINDVANQQMTFVEFDTPVLITESFFAGVILPTVTGDTVALWSNTDGDTNPGIAWEQWNDNQWYPMSSMSTWGLNLSQAIFPIVNYGDLPLMADFSASSTAIQVGQSVSFSDESTGNPTTWEWTFEGGTPANSNEQNPVVTYNEIGSYDVTLTAGNDTATDTKIKPGFITVGSVIDTDTLNFPLPGTYAVYITDQNGFVTGNNEWGDLAKANFYDYNQDSYITGVLIEFAYATGGNPNIEVAIWDNGGSNGSPGSKIGNNTVPLNTIKGHITNEQMTYVAFNPPININASFYAGFMLPTTTGDTLAVWSNMDNEINPGIAWELWEDNTWYAFSSGDSWGLNIAMAIFPIVQSSLVVDENTATDLFEIYPNPSDGIYYLSTKEILRSSAIIEVFNSTGVLVRRSAFDSNQTNILDLSCHPSGLYFVRISEGGNIYSRKIIKE